MFSALFPGTGRSGVGHAFAAVELRCSILQNNFVQYNILHIDVDVRPVLRIGEAGSKRQSE